MSTVNCFSLDNIKWEKESLFEIGENTISIWKIKITADPGSIGYLSSLLNADEIARAGRYHHEKDRQRFITSRSSLRILLSWYLKTEPATIAFARGPNKKPYIKQPISSIHYNTSHADNYVLLILSNTEVGVDVEKTDTNFDWREILHSTFGGEEIAWVNQSEDPKLAFYLLWTRKEALAKATAGGLQDDLSIFPCLDGVHPLNPKHFFSSWEIRSFKVDADTVGSVAYLPSVTTRKFFSLNVENLSL